MLSRTRFLAGVLGLLSLVSTAAAQDGVVLTYRFPKEEPLIYRTTTELNQSMQVGGQTFETKVTQTEVNTLALEEVTKENHLKLKRVNHRLSIKAEMGPAGNYSFDSESAEREKGTALGSQLNPVYETLSGIEYHVTITPQGKVEKLEGYKEILENVLKDNPLAAQITGGGSEEALKESLVEVFVPLSEKPVKEGDSWEVPFELEMPKIGKAKGKRVYKYEGTLEKDKAKIARITVSVEISFDFDVTTEGVKVTGNIGTDSSKGDVRFDIEKGQIVSANLEYVTSGTINTEVGDRTLKAAVKQTQKRSTQQLSSLPNP